MHNMSENLSKGSHSSLAGRNDCLDSGVIWMVTEESAIPDHPISLCQQTRHLLMAVSQLSGGLPDRTLQEVVVVEFLGCQQFLQCRLPTTETLDQPEVAEALQPWCLDNQKIGGMAR